VVINLHHPQPLDADVIQTVAAIFLCLLAMAGTSLLVAANPLVVATSLLAVTNLLVVTASLLVAANLLVMVDTNLLVAAIQIVMQIPVYTMTN
jgi:hypothetical protein